MNNRLKPYDISNNMPKPKNLKYMEFTDPSKIIDLFSKTDNLKNPEAITFFLSKYFSKEEVELLLKDLNYNGKKDISYIYTELNDFLDVLTVEFSFLVVEKMQDEGKVEIIPDIKEEIKEVFGKEKFDKHENIIKEMLEKALLLDEKKELVKKAEKKINKQNYEFKLELEPLLNEKQKEIFEKGLSFISNILKSIGFIQNEEHQIEKLVDFISGKENILLAIDKLIGEKVIEEEIEIVLKILLNIKSFLFLFNITDNTKIEDIIKSSNNIEENIKNIDKLIKKLEYLAKLYSFEEKVNISNLYKFILENNYSLQIFEILNEKGILSKENIEKISTIENKNHFLHTIYFKNKSFIIKPDLVNFLNDYNIKYFFLLSLNKKIENKFFEYLLENEIQIDGDEKIVLLQNFFRQNVDITKLLEIDLKTLKELKNKKIPVSGELLELLKLGKTIDEALSIINIIRYKNNIVEKLNLLKGIDGLDFSKIFELLNELNYNLSETEFKAIKSKIEKIYNSNFKNFVSKIESIFKKNIDLSLFKSFVNTLYRKKTKKNSIKLSDIIAVGGYIFENYDIEDINFLMDIFNNNTTTLSSNFSTNYEYIISGIIKHSNFIKDYLENNKNTISISEIVEQAKNSFQKEKKDEIMEKYFPEDFVEDILKLTDEKLNKFINIAKWLENKKDEDFYLELLTLEEDKFNRFYFLIKNLHILGVGIKENYKAIFEYVNKGIFTEEKLTTLKPYIKKASNLKLEYESFLLSLLLDYIFGEDNISLIDQFFDIENSEKVKDEEFKRNTGISGLAGWKGSVVIRKFQKLGWKLKRVNGKVQGKGDHYIMFKKVGETTIYTMIPNHNPIGAKTLFDILNRAKISKEDFLNA